MHHDYHFATERNGTQDIFLNTPNQAAWFERYVTDWTGPKGRLGRMTFRMQGSVFPGDTMELHAVVTKVETDDTGCGWVDLDVTLRVGGEVATDVHGACRVAGRRRRQPVDPPRRRVASLTTTETATSDGSRLHRRTGDAAGDSARRLREARVARRSCARSKTTRSAIPTRSGRSSPSSGLLGLTIPEEYDGSGDDDARRSVVYEEFGRALAPSPHFVSSVLCGGVLERGG